MVLVDFKNVSTVGLESADYPNELAGVRANEARYYWNKYKHEFTTACAKDHEKIIDLVNEILQEKELYFPYKPLEVSEFTTENIKHIYVFYQNGLSINVMYAFDDPKKRAVGFKLCENMEIPAELKDKFKFARQRSKLAGTIRGSYFKIKKEYLFD